MADLAALATISSTLDFIMVPKVTAASVLDSVHALWSSAPPLLSLIEMPAGVLDAVAIAQRSRAGLMFGAVDLSTELGVELGSETIAVARTLAILAAKAAGVEVLGTPCLDVQDDAALAAETRRARGLGFTGKAAIHPRQVPVIQAAFAPTEEEVAVAQRALAAFSAGGEQAMLFEGRLLERPMVERYRRLLLASERTKRART